MNLSKGWSIWPWACLRAPGFAADRIELLRAPDALGALDHVVSAEAGAQRAREAAIAALERVQVTKAVSRALRALRRGELPAAGDGAEATAELDALRAAVAAHAAAVATAEAALDTAQRRVATELNAWAAEPAVREAILWQNRVAVHGSIAALARRPAEATDSKTREQRRLVASYLQRYCVKNDTIGFFGPVGWAELADRPEAIALRAGPQLLATRRVYFEYWAIDTLAQALARDPELLPFLRPRRTPSLWLDGSVLQHPSGKRNDLPAPVARLLAAIDGAKPARAIARELADVGPEPEILELLGELAERKLCSWTLEIPTETFAPEVDLRELIAVAEGPPRERAEAALDRLEAGRAAVAAAAGDPGQLDPALHALEATFEELTGASATRKGGETYAGRMLVFEDARRDLQVTLGRPIGDRLGPPLALVLASARWYTHTIATRYLGALRELHDRLRRETGSSAIAYQRFSEQLPPLFPGNRADHGIVHDVVAELHARWQALLGAAAGDRAIARRSQDLAPGVATAFAAPGPGWPSARHHSPDILIAAASADAIARGDYRLVLGELHVGLSTLMPCLVKEHPEPAALVALREADLMPAVAPVWSKEINRADFYSLSRRDLDVERADVRSARPRDHVLATGDLLIDEVDDQLVVRSRDGRRSFPIIAFFERQLLAESFARFRILGGQAHTPRVALDDLVVERETWRMPAAELAFAAAATELGRFVGARSFAGTHGMPRQVFAKTDAEAKPFFVDFDSPILVDILVRNLRRATKIAISEMLPDLAECWLPDAAGNRYTSELRLVATDPEPWRPG